MKRLIRQMKRRMRVSLRINQSSRRLMKNNRGNEEGSYRRRRRKLEILSWREKGEGGFGKGRQIFSFIR